MDFIRKKAGGLKKSSRKEFKKEIEKKDPNV